MVPPVHVIESQRQRVGRALTLPEVIVVMAIVALLLVMFLPGLGAAREQARRMYCANNMKSWGTALQMYRLDFGEYIPTEGFAGKLNNMGWGHEQPMTWYNTLPPYLDAPAYKDFEGVAVSIKERSMIDVWICPTKNMSKAYKSDSGKNQFHYAMNDVLDGMGSTTASHDTPGFPDMGYLPIKADRFINKPTTVYMFEIAWNSPRGSPRDVATMYNVSFASGLRYDKFHGDYANILYLDGAVTHCDTEDLFADRDMRFGDIRWEHPRFYWGYPPPR